jgi:hypothetical protein
MLKHVGRHGDRKVAIIFREIPNEDHMCLVIYPDVLPTHIHNSVMSVLESAPGQAATNLADVFHRNLLPDGRGILQTLHVEGMLKKVATNQIILTPTPSSSVKLDEVNKLVREMESGEQALKRMQEIDQNSGLVDPGVKREAERAFKRQQLERDAAQQKSGQPPVSLTGNDGLSDSALASNMLAQAKRMEQEAQGLISEAARMKKEAERMFPGVSTNVTGQQPAIAATESKKGRGRPKKVVSAVQ